MRIKAIVAGLALGLAFALSGVSMAADEKAAEAPCCAKAKKAGKTCDHACCVEAAKDNKACPKCSKPKKKN
jgi:hypothetical protein